jgi:hypothetical protein
VPADILLCAGRWLSGERSAADHAKRADADPHGLPMLRADLQASLPSLPTALICRVPLAAPTGLLFPLSGASPLVLAWQFQILDAYVAPAGGPMHFPPPMGAGPRYRRTVSDPASLCLTDAVMGAQIGSNLRARAEISSGGGRYYALCDAIEEQDVIIWR